MAHSMNQEESNRFLDKIFNLDKLWVFGYGSILWKTGFHFESKNIGYIKGFARRFWQGSTSHRGTPENPGRVATLVPSSDKEGKVWGNAYELVGHEMITEALTHLGVRECLLGGYITLMTPFYSRNHESEPFDALLFTATEENELFLGPAPLDKLAEQIVSCRGPCGHNVQYVKFLADYMAEHIPEEDDEHLFGLMHNITRICKENKISVDDLIAISSHHVIPKNKYCTKCNATCSEYAFCDKCRGEVIKTALICCSGNSSKSDVASDANLAVYDNTDNLMKSDAVELEKPGHPTTKSSAAADLEKVSPKTCNDVEEVEGAQSSIW